MDQREILQKVASGELTPAEAAELLADSETTPVGADRAPTPASAATTARTPPDQEGAARRIRFVGSFRSAKIVGDPDVREAVVEGPHVVRRDGDLLVIEDEIDEHGHAFAGAFSEEGGSGFRFRSKRRAHITLGVRSRPAPIEIRMNPSLALDVELAAGTLHVRDVRGPITADVSAGSAHLDGIASPIDITVAAGSVHANGVLDHGDSRIKCDAGSVSLQLDEGSSVRIVSQVGLGKVEIDSDDSSVKPGIMIEGKHESVIGDGAGTLTIECSLGKVAIAARR